LVGRCVHVGIKEEWIANIGNQAKPTHENIIRLAPPLVISEEEIQHALQIIGEAIHELPSLKGKAEDAVIPNSEKGVHIGLDA
jgi:ornithine--oxo-acid transaminase